jgi:hypothetical protein
MEITVPVYYFFGAKLAISSRSSSSTHTHTHTRRLDGEEGEHEVIPGSDHRLVEEDLGS